MEFFIHVLSKSMDHEHSAVNGGETALYALAAGLVSVALAITKVCAKKGFFFTTPCGEHSCICDLNAGRPSNHERSDSREIDRSSDRSSEDDESSRKKSNHRKHSDRHGHKHGHTHGHSRGTVNNVNEQLDSVV